MTWMVFGAGVVTGVLMGAFVVFAIAAWLKTQEWR